MVRNRAVLAAPPVVIVERHITSLEHPETEPEQAEADAGYESLCAND